MKCTVFAVALNHQSQQVAWYDAFNQPPYLVPPEKPVWFIKPRNTLIGHQADIPCPNGEKMVLSGATISLVIGKRARKVRPQNASSFIAGYALANEISLPETNFYRPSIKTKCRDGFCPLGSEVRTINIEDLKIVTEINGNVVQEWNTGDLLYSPTELLCALSEFITLEPGDRILIGTPHQRVRIMPTDQVTVRVADFMPLTNTLVQQGAAQ